jgi:hypothetical protein
MADDLFVELGDALAFRLERGCVLLWRDVLDLGGGAVVNQELLASAEVVRATSTCKRCASTGRPRRCPRVPLQCNI